ncbi:hypothetical protein E8E13_011525 [Curvularia kusanoi]|uniref:Kinesin-like protein n=1 Tax=Curvularia kusanoi TaxID=90978 RepID=A0A9P4TP90_CURKU|nr:hypothetical protein E8E13_011525 [Curvularia kusanoi]
MPPKFQPAPDFEVYARWRPLPPPIPATTTTTPTPFPTHSSNPLQNSTSFTHVFPPSSTNADVYTHVAAPTLPAVLRGETCNFFAYGHSGSGKTHTIVGYEFGDEQGDGKGGLGLCLSAARDLFGALERINKGKAGIERKGDSGVGEEGEGEGARERKEGKQGVTVKGSGSGETIQKIEIEKGDAKHKEKDLAIGLRIFHLRNKLAHDLLNHNLPCHIREGPDGTTHIRGPTETLPDGKIRVRPIVSIPCWDLASLRATLLSGLANRDIGSSSVHDESSRTHAVIELEIVNRKLLDARDALIERESELVPVGKRATDVYIAEQLASLIKLADGRYIQNPERPINQKVIDEAEAQKRACEERVRDAERAVAACFDGSKERCLGGKYVFVDLAGAEYFSASPSSPLSSSPSGDSAAKAKQIKQTATEQQQGRQINTDLFALKEVIRARAQGKGRIPYRASPLTMVLRSCFEIGRGRKEKATWEEERGGSSAMIVTLSAEEGMEAATRNSLKYGELVGSAGK